MLLFDSSGHALLRHTVDGINEKLVGRVRLQSADVDLQAGDVILAGRELRVRRTQRAVYPVGDVVSAAVVVWWLPGESDDRGLVVHHCMGIPGS